MNKLTIINTFHNTEITIIPKTVSAEFDVLDITVSHIQMRRVEKALCGIAGCACGDHTRVSGGVYDGYRVMYDVSMDTTR